MANYGTIRILDPDYLLPPDADGTIRVGPNPSYEKAFLGLLHTMVGSNAGKTVVTAIARRHEWDSMIIVPYKKKDPNASATMLDPHGGRHKGTDDDYTDKTKKHHQIRGSGDGSSTVVQFSPHTWQPDKKCHAPGALADEILIHEMFHGLRQLKGLMHHQKVGHGYDNEEEFFAILIANIYTSEKHPHRMLRANHHGFHVLAQHDAVGLTEMFLETPGNRHRVEKLIHQQRSLCDHIALVPSKFNPIRGVLIEGDTLD